MKTTRKNAKKTKNTKTFQRDMERLDLAIARWEALGKKQRDKSTARLFARDVEKLRLFRQAVGRGEFRDAQRRADCMDTILREQIPPRLYNRVFDLAQ